MARQDSGVSVSGEQLSASDKQTAKSSSPTSTSSSSGDTLEYSSGSEENGSEHRRSTKCKESDEVFDKESVRDHVDLKRADNSSADSGAISTGSGVEGAPLLSPIFFDAPFQGESSLDAENVDVGEPPMKGVTVGKVQYFSREDFETSAAESTKTIEKINVTMRSLKPRISTKALARLKKRNEADPLKKFVHMENMVQLLDFNATALANERSSKVFKVVSRLAISMLIPYECILIGHRMWLRESSLASPFSELDMTELESRAIFFVAIGLALDWHSSRSGDDHKMAQEKLNRIIGQYYSADKREALRIHMSLRLGWQPVLDPVEPFMEEFVKQIGLPSIVERHLIMNASDVLVEIRGITLVILVVPSLQALLCLIQAAKSMGTHIDKQPLTMLIVAAAVRFLEIPECCHILQGFLKDESRLPEYLVKSVNTAIFRTSAFLAWRPSPWMGFDPSMPPLDVLASHAPNEPRLDSSICRVVYNSKTICAPVHSTCFITRLSFGDGLPSVYCLDAERADHASPEYTARNYTVEIVDHKPEKSVESLYTVGHQDLKALFSLDKSADPQARKRYMPALKKQLQLDLLKDNLLDPIAGNVEVVRISNEHRGDTDVVRLLLRIHRAVEGEAAVDRQGKASLDLCIGSAIALDLLTIERDIAMSETFDRVLDVIALKYKHHERNRANLDETEESESVSSSAPKEAAPLMSNVPEKVLPVDSKVMSEGTNADSRTAAGTLTNAQLDSDLGKGGSSFGNKSDAGSMPPADEKSPKKDDEPAKKASGSARRNRKTVADFLLALSHPPVDSHAQNRLGDVKQRKKQQLYKGKPALTHRIVINFDEKKAKEPKLTKPKKSGDGSNLPEADFLKKAHVLAPSFVPIAKADDSTPAEVTLMRVECIRKKLHRAYTEYKDLRFGKLSREQFLQTTEALTATLHLLKDLEDSLI